LIVEQKEKDSQQEGARRCDRKERGGGAATSGAAKVPISAVHLVYSDDWSGSGRGSSFDTMDARKRATGGDATFDGR
jgi:hypothetical protein